MFKGINTYDFKLLLTNARSLSPKIESLHTCFEAHQLDMALVTESWLKDGEVLDRDVLDLEWGTDLKIIYKNRPKNAAGRRKVGGGVSIIYSKSRCNLRERRVVGNKFELVLAVGRVGRLPRQVAVFCIYLEPRMKVAELAELCGLISREILSLKSNGDPMIFIGGDLNRKCLDDAIQDFPDLTQQNFDPTRGDACLDVLFSNCSTLTPSMWPPLETREGVKSDHRCVVFSGSEQITKDFTWVKKTSRKHSDAALQEYGRRLATADWDTMLPSHLGPDELVDRFQAWTGALTDELFPLKTVRVRSNEHPWITDGIRRLGKQKVRVYKREGKSQLWHNLCARQERLIEDSKSTYVDKIEEGGPNTRKYFEAVKKLGTAPTASSTGWDLPHLFPDCSPAQAGEEAADYFTRITDTFVPLASQDLVNRSPRAPISVQEAARRLKLAKKPNSSVEGDLLPRVVKAHHQLLAPAVTIIFNSVFRSGRWPSAWKTETTVVIPKVPNPANLGDCRNISCTPFLSKVLEGVLLDDLRAEVPLDPSQYGGMKGCSVDHLLVDLFEAVLEPLERGSPSLVLGIDYEKAFNRLDHEECLRQLEALGASTTSIDLIRAFLTDRSMCIRVGGQLSSLHKLNGGSPQGSILGCFLYCAATQQINLNLIARPRPLPHIEDPAEPPEEQAAAPPPRTPDSDHEGFGLMDAAVTPISSPSDSSFLTADSPDLDWSAALRQLESILMFKYVDDTTTVEAVPPGQGVRHITTARSREQIPAPVTDRMLGAVVQRAGEIGMRVNCRKTQLLCVSLDNGYDTWAALQVDGQSIESQETMKLLGFMLGASPGVAAHVDLLKKKFRARFWSLIHLRRAGIKGHRLYRLYCSLIRPVLEVNCVIFHSMLTTGQTELLERMQKQVIRLCFGHFDSYEEVRELHSLESLRERRVKAVRRFVAKAMNNPRFAERWFVRRQDVDVDIRRRRPYVEKRARTERYLKSPLLHMQKIANDIAAGA